MNVVRYFGGAQSYFTWLKQVGDQLGVCPLAFFLEDDITHLDLISEVSFPSPGEAVGVLPAGVTLHVRYDPNTLTVQRVAYHFNGEVAYVWEGTMSIEQFLAEDYPADVVYGSAQADVLHVYRGTAYAGGGNDIIELFNGGVAYGQDGIDTFVVNNHGHMVIKDYRFGEKIYFPDYENLTELGADFVGLTEAEGGFTLHFKSGGPYGPEWSLTLEGVAPHVRILDDVVFGAETYSQVYGPLFELAGYTDLACISSA